MTVHKKKKYSCLQVIHCLPKLIQNKVPKLQVFFFLKLIYSTVMLQTAYCLGKICLRGETEQLTKAEKIKRYYNPTVTYLVQRIPKTGSLHCVHLKQALLLHSTHSHSSQPG